MRVLVVEDEDRIRRDLAVQLKNAGYVVEEAADGENAWFRGDTEEFDAVVLDLGLPKMDGLQVLKRWRDAGRDIPILILTARGSWTDRVEGIDAGADDYLVKPFRMEEVVARVRALIRRSAGRANPVLSAHGITLDTRRARATVDGQPIPLSPLEFRLLSYLLHHRGRVVSRAELVEHIYHEDVEPDSNALEVLVGRVRRKVGSEVIETRRGHGYLVSTD
ncbi:MULTISPECIES: response regulator transcription factor [Hyphomicrobiales]|jgi:two-component system OmpR family response regulator|uniref:Transcriptional regulator n=2 Tax=Prosthecodimorpha TaxID=2981530 RepID=A0A0P6W2T7_9HYPH|nr:MULTISPECIES: response regulator transcription factor [Hyphomicrobiales]KPL52612.1 transcriptional regulator [Prosthecomicrobium hirschii]MBT9292818.1 response regulator transcription factor [Prosthecodimorpha staleyi]MCW1841480.1 response regulator transcription factor [Prosthecomicrobium hirschii]